MISGGLISLTFDDALDQHVDVALPMLLDEGLRGTFYAHLSAPSLIRRTDVWRRLADVGNELGNHTIFHPMDARKLSVREGNALDLYSLDRMQLELQLANEWLSSIDGRTDRTFAYPCSNSVLGSYGRTCRLLFRMGLRNTRWPGLAEQWKIDPGNTRRSYQLLMADMFVAARGGGLYVSGESLEISAVNRYFLPSAAVEGHSFEQMRGFLERSLGKNSWSILQFHGVGGGHRMDCDPHEFRQLTRWLGESHQDRVVTVVKGAQMVFGKKDTVTVRNA